MQFKAHVFIVAMLTESALLTLDQELESDIIQTTSCAVNEPTGSEGQFVSVSFLPSNTGPGPIIMSTVSQLEASFGSQAPPHRVSFHTRFPSDDSGEEPIVSGGSNGSGIFEFIIDRHVSF